MLKKVELCAAIVALFVAALLPPPIFAASPEPEAAAWPAKTHYRYAEVRGRRLFYREAGEPSKPLILLLHGFPASSHAYRELIPLLSGRYHVIAPDNLGSGYSDHPANQIYTFDLLADFIAGFIQALKLDHYVLYMQDFGAPVGFRVMMREPRRLRGLIVQNANAYLDGLTPARQAFFRNAHQDRSAENLAKLFELVSVESVVHRQYLRDVAGKEDLIAPDAWTHDLSFLQTEAEKKIQVQLFQDYYNNLLAYSQWQAFLRKWQPPTLIVWGKNDPAFIPAGAEAYRHDLPKAELHLLDAGHFAVEEKPAEIAQFMTRFMEALPK